MLGARVVKLLEHRREPISFTKFIKHFDAILFALFNKLSVVWSISSVGLTFLIIIALLHGTWFINE